MDKEMQSQDVIGYLVHSYNNYLSGLMGFSELALMESQEDNVKQRLEMALESGREAVNFGKQLLSSIGRLQVKMSPVEILSLLTELGDGEECSFVSNTDSDMIFVKSDLEWFDFCIRAVIQFCADFSKKPGSKIHVSQTNEDVKIYIEPVHFDSDHFDFTEEQVINLFQPFYSSRVLLGQKDVGLAVVSGFLSQMGGSIEWKAGSGFLISIPVLDEG